MRRIELKRIATVAHPNDPDIKIEIVQPTQREMVAFSAISPPTGAEAAQDAVARYDKIVGFVADHIQRISGLIDAATNKPLVLEQPMDEAQRAVIESLDLSCQIERDVEVLDDGKPTGKLERKTVIEWFPTFLFGRLMAEETWNLPLAGTPSTKRTSGG